MQCYSGRCEKPDGTPGCTTPADCIAGDVEMGCNQETGQCFYTDGQCDANPGGNGVCSPGSNCEVDPLSALGGMPKTVCKCNQFLMTLPIVQCHPGINCNQIPPGILPEEFDGPVHVDRLRSDSQQRLLHGSMTLRVS